MADSGVAEAEARAAAAPRSLFVAVIVLLPFLEFSEILIESIETLVPEPAVVLHPIRDLTQRLRGQAAWPPLRLAPPSDQSGALQDLQVLGHGGQGHVERLGEL